MDPPTQRSVWAFVMWTEEAKCLDHETNIFFEIYEENPKVRKTIDAICSQCPVRRRCFAEGVSGKHWGVWGGVYLEDGKVSKEFNSHRDNKSWQDTWQSLTMEA